MGKICSNTGCDSICNCFENDRNIKEISTTRLFQTKWIWTCQHEINLFQTLCDEHDNLSTDIAQLIKEFTYDLKEEFYIPTYKICTELYYPSSKRLIAKKFCKSWYKAQQDEFKMTPLTINLFGESSVKYTYIYIYIYLML